MTTYIYRHEHKHVRTCNPSLNPIINVQFLFHLGKANAVTHTDGSQDKNGATFIWNAPGGMADEKIQFVATVVKGRTPKSEWYSGIKSNIVNV